MNVDKRHHSVLKMHDVYFTNIEFTRDQQELNFDEIKVNASVSSKVNKENQLFVIRLGFDIGIESNDAFKVSIEVEGVFNIPTDIPDGIRDSLLKRNTIAILFPYVRAQITTLTAQPGMEPIVLPALNINALMDEMEEEAS